MYVQQTYKEQDYVIPLFQIGTALSNMPANDGVEVISDSASDTGVPLTILGTKYGTNVLMTETVTLNGVTQVATTETAWNNVYGFWLGDVYGKNSVVAVGTITVREASGNAAIGTITAGNRSKGTIAFKLSGREILLAVGSGNTFINCNSQLIYPTTNNSFKYAAAANEYLKVPAGPNGFIFLLGDNSGSTAQIKVLRD